MAKAKTELWIINVIHLVPFCPFAEFVSNTQSQMQKFAHTYIKHSYLHSLTVKTQLKYTTQFQIIRSDHQMFSGGVDRC